ncbi:MAG: 4-phosphoerythronate dehydrogenase [Agarilytica sp.]
MSLNIVADENIPHVETIFSGLGKLNKVQGRNLTSSQLGDADVLLVRSVTQVNESLLKGSRVRFVGTSTIGVDHLDTEYLKQENIRYASAPGCNAWAVVQYVVSVLASLEEFEQGKRVVIVGGGNVGGRVYDTLNALGFDCAIVDPFLTEACGRKLVEFERVYQADILCLHTPLTHHKKHPTFHLFNDSELSKLKSNTLLINAGRGAVINNLALLNLLKQGTKLRVALDVWENEPNVAVGLLPYLIYATPHIAGYSYEGRLNGALMIYERLSMFLGKSEKDTLQALAPIRDSLFGEPKACVDFDLKDALLSCYDVRDDDARFRASAETLPEGFDELRKHYPLRREFSHYVYRKVQDKDRLAYHALKFAEEGR